jgi:hypothetical protein
MPGNLSDQLLAGGQIDGLRRKNAGPKNEGRKGNCQTRRGMHEQILQNRGGSRFQMELTRLGIAA